MIKTTNNSNNKRINSGFSISQWSLAVGRAYWFKFRGVWGWTLPAVMLRQPWGQEHNTEAAPAQRTYTFWSQKVTLSQTAVEFDVH